MAVKTQIAFLARLLIAPLFSLIAFTPSDSLQAQPANDNCITAQPVTIPASGTVCINSSSLNATSSNTTNVCSPTVVNEVWFTYVAAGPSNTITVTPNGATPLQQPVITISDDVCGSATFNTCNAAATAGGTATASWAYAAGSQIRISVAGIMGDGTFEICITSETPPPTPGSSCGGATPTCDPTSFTLNSSAGNPSSGISPSCFNILGTPQLVQNDIWYVFSVGQTGTLEFTANLNGVAEMDWAVFDITNGCPGTEVSCNYFFSGGNSGSLGLALPAGGEFNAPINVTAGNTYAIMIDNYDNNGVGFDFDWGGTFQMAPTADFTVNTPSACNSLTTTFNNTSVGASTYSWDFGNSATSTAQNPPSQTYNSPGTYFVTLEATSAAGCTNTFSSSVEVFPDPTLSFATTDESCAGACDGELTVNPSGTGPFTYSWTGGGNAATESNLCANTYNVIVTDQSNGCSATGTETVASGGATSDATITPAGPFCIADAPVNLTGADPGGTWSGTGITNPALGTFDPSTAGAGTWTITYTISGACGDVQTTDITVSASLDATITPAGPFCTSEPATNLVAVDPGGTWSGTGITDPALGTFDPSVAGVGNWTITYTISGGCGSSDSETIVVGQNQDATITPVGPFCTSEPAVNLVGADAGGLWSGIGITDVNQGTFDPSVAGIGTWTITYTISGNCGDVQTTDIAVGEVTFSQTTTDVDCFGNTSGEISISNESGTAPHLFSIDGGTNTQTTGLFQSLGAGSFNLVVTDDNGCASQVVAVTISQPSAISLNATMDQEASCGNPDGAASVGANGGTVANDYQYSWNSTPVQSTSTATNLPPGTYVVTVTDDNGCSETASVDVTSTPGFTTTIDSYTDETCFQACDGTATAVVDNSAIFPVVYSWNDVQNQTTATAVDLCAGDYEVTVTDDAGCISLTSVTIAEPTELIAQLSTDTTPICIGGTANLTATLNGGTAPYSGFSWTASPADPTLNGSAQNPSVSPIETTVYSFSSMDANGCMVGPLDITIGVLLPLQLDVIRPLASPDTGICPGDAAILDLSAAGGDGNFAYYLQPDLNNPVSVPMVVRPTATTVYDFTVTDACSTPVATAASTVTVFDLPVVDFEGDELAGCDPHQTSFTDLTAPAPVSWEWTFHDPDASINTSDAQNPLFGFSGPGMFDVTLAVVTSDGCSAELTKTNYIEVYPRPVANFEASPEVTDVVDPRITFMDYSTGDIASWDWDFGDGEFSTEQSPAHAYLDTGTFSVDLIVVSEDGCVSSTRGRIIVNPILTFYVPNAFTPDDDSFNPNFRGYGEGYDWSTYELFIYNRWGEEIFHSTDAENAWNGTYKNSEVEAGIYGWKILIGDFNGRIYPFRGHVTLIR